MLDVILCHTTLVGYECHLCEFCRKEVDVMKGMDEKSGNLPLKRMRSSSDDFSSNVFVEKTIGGEAMGTVVADNKPKRKDPHHHVTASVEGNNQRARAALCMALLTLQYGVQPLISKRFTGYQSRICSSFPSPRTTSLVLPSETIALIQLSLSHNLCGVCMDRSILLKIGLFLVFPILHLG